MLLDISRPYIYVGEHTVLTNLKDGVSMFLDLRDPVCLAILLNGEWESAVTTYFRHSVKPGMTVLDIGAHCGYFSMLAGTLVGPTGSVHGFEPNPFHHRNYLKNTVINGIHPYTHLHKVMTSNRRGEETITTYGEGGTSIYLHVLKELNGPTVTTVKTGLITDFLPVAKADIIKVDIDGGEPYIIDSLMEIIDNSGHMTIFFEYLPFLWDGIDPLTILQPFADRGFLFYHIQVSGELVQMSIAALLQYKEVAHIDLMIIR